MQVVNLDDVSFNATLYAEQIAAGLLTEEEFVSNGLREQLYIQFTEEDRRSLLLRAYRYIKKFTLPWASISH